MKKIDTIVFDLGGVLVELGGMKTMHSWMGNKYNDEDLMELWLSSKTVRNFESGKCSPEGFVENIVKELDLPVSPQQFLERFVTWPSGLYPGVQPLLKKLGERYTIACLSNTNEVHWPIVMNDLGLNTYFDHHFPSHLTGLFKPDSETFEYILNSLGKSPEQVLFFDDSATNIAAAQKLGIQAIRTVGFEEVESAVTRMGLLNAA